MLGEVLRGGVRADDEGEDRWRNLKTGPSFGDRVRDVSVPCLSVADAPHKTLRGHSGRDTPIPSPALADCIFSRRPTAVKRSRPASSGSAGRGRGVIVVCLECESKVTVRNLWVVADSSSIQRMARATGKATSCRALVMLSSPRDVR